MEWHALSAPLTKPLWSECGLCILFYLSRRSLLHNCCAARRGNRRSVRSFTPYSSPTKSHCYSVTLPGSVLWYWTNKWSLFSLPVATNQDRPKTYISHMFNNSGGSCCTQPSNTGINKTHYSLMWHVHQNIMQYPTEQVHEILLQNVDLWNIQFNM